VASVAVALVLPRIAKERAPQDTKSAMSLKRNRLELKLLHTSLFTTKLVAGKHENKLIRTV